MGLAFLRQSKIFPPQFSGILFLLLSVLKEEYMKQSIERLIKNEATHEGFQMGSTIIMILLFLTFWGVSFYVLLNSLA
jgi:hypothetical protein